MLLEELFFPKLTLSSWTTGHDFISLEKMILICSHWTHRLIVHFEFWVMQNWSSSSFSLHGDFFPLLSTTDTLSEFCNRNGFISKEKNVHILTANTNSKHLLKWRKRIEAQIQTGTLYYGAMCWSEVAHTKVSAVVMNKVYWH